MYSIDINLLKDRPEYQSTVIKSGNSDQKTKISNYSKTPIFVGLGVGLVALLATGGGWLYLDGEGKALQAKQALLDKQLGAAKTQEAQLNDLNSKVAQAQQESKSLANVFNLVRPWSAILQEFRDNIPQGVQIKSIAQITNPVGAAAKAKAPLSKAIAAPPSVDGNGAVSKPGAASPDAAASPSAVAAASPTAAPSPGAVAFDAPITRIEVDGVAQSFNDVNSFMLTLKKSVFFNPDETQLVTANLVEESVAVPGTGQAAGQPAQKVTTKSIKYKIQTSLKQVPATELLRDLERKGAVGLVTRLKSLQQQQVIQP
jgi:type IV pilus assembly protein PilN